jgi:[protein-PII] uridylyltransferase
MPMAAAAPPLLERVSPDLSGELKCYLTRHRKDVEAMILSGGPEAGLPASRRYAKVCDGLLSSLFHAVRAAMLRDGSWQPVSLAAVGSFGRGAVSFNSDLDVRLLAERELEGARHVAEAILYPLWDVGLTIGHQVMAVDEIVELGRQDLPTATSLLDWRVLAGAEEPSRQMLVRVREACSAQASIATSSGATLLALGDQHDRYSGSVHLRTGREERSWRYPRSGRGVLGGQGAFA